MDRITRSVRAGLESDTTHGAVVPPIYLTSTFAFEDFATARKYDYTRSGNPTRDILAEAISALEGAAGAVITCTGTAAMTTVVQAKTEPGDVVLAPHDCYGGTWRLFESLTEKGYLRVEYVDFTDHAAVDEALARRPRMVWLETPSNPLLRITDLAYVVPAAKAAGAIVVADNTFLSPLNQRPLEYGVDLVIHSTTKFLNGHSDVVGGAIVCSTDELVEEMKFFANVLGVTGSPFDSYQTLRGMRSLAPRMRQHEANAAAVAEFLSQAEGVLAVYYPGLTTHPRHDVAARQQDGYGGMVSFEVDGGADAVRRLVDGLRCFSLAESLGGVESLVDHPETMTHLAMSPEARERAGVTSGLLRLSVGIEHVDDLIADLRDGLERARG